MEHNQTIVQTQLQQATNTTNYNHKQNKIKREFMSAIHLDKQDRIFLKILEI